MRPARLGSIECKRKKSIRVKSQESCPRKGQRRLGWVWMDSDGFDVKDKQDWGT